MICSCACESEFYSYLKTILKNNDKSTIQTFQALCLCKKTKIQSNWVQTRSNHCNDSNSKSYYVIIFLFVFDIVRKLSEDALSGFLFSAAKLLYVASNFVVDDVESVVCPRRYDVTVKDYLMNRTLIWFSFNFFQQPIIN